MVVAQLVERLLPPPEIRGSNPNIGKVLTTNCKLNRKDENKEKEAGNGPSLKKGRTALFCYSGITVVRGCITFFRWEEMMVEGRLKQKKIVLDK